MSKKRGRKTNRKKLDEIEKNLMTVEDLVKHLLTLPQKASVGVIGHFGEFHGYHILDFHYSEGRHCYITPDYSWRNNTHREINVVDVSQIDIGPDPC